MILVYLCLGIVLGILVGEYLRIVFKIYKLVQEIRDLALKILRSLESASADRIEFYIEADGQLRKVDHMNLKVNQKLPLSIQVKDKFGNAAKVDGAPAWSLTVPALASLEVAPDGLSAVLSPSGQVGSLVVQVNADADLGEGVKALLGELPVELLPGEAVSIEIAAGEASDL